MDMLSLGTNLVIMILVAGFGVTVGALAVFFGYKAWQNYVNTISLRAHKLVFEQYRQTQERFITTFLDHMAMAPQFSPPMEQPEEKSPVRDLQTSIIPSTRFDIVFDSDLTSFVANGSFAYGWRRIMQEIVHSIDEKESAFPEGTNTVLVRSVRMTEEGKNEYILEPLKNENLKKLSSE